MLDRGRGQRLGRRRGSAVDHHLQRDLPRERHLGRAVDRRPSRHGRRCPRFCTGRTSRRAGSPPRPGYSPGHLTTSALTGFWHIGAADTLPEMLALALILAATRPLRSRRSAPPRAPRRSPTTDVANWSDYSGDELQMLIQGGVDGGRGGRARRSPCPRPRSTRHAETDLGLSKRQATVPRHASACSKPASRTRPNKHAAQSVTPDQIEAYVAANPRLDPEERRITSPRDPQPRTSEASAQGDHQRPDLVERRQALRPRPHRDDRQERNRSRLRAARAQDEEGQDHPLRHVRLPDHEDHPEAPRAARRPARAGLGDPLLGGPATSGRGARSRTAREMAAPAPSARRRTTHADCGNPPSGE